MYFKAYLTEGDSNKLSGISGVLHVDLINSNNKIDQSLKLQVIDGVAWGDFALPDSLPQDNYRVRAYTKWMLNDGGSNYFDKTISLGSIRANKIAESITQSPKIKADVQFFPEGGKLINGISSKIAFKAIGGNGLGINIKGEIIDNENRQVETFASAHLGMGYFYLNPAEGKTYKAKITYPDNSTDVIDLPWRIRKGLFCRSTTTQRPGCTLLLQLTKLFTRKIRTRISPSLPTRPG